MFRKIFKGTLIASACTGTAALVYPDHFTPVQKIINVGMAGGQIFYVYKYQHDKTIE
jgi:hypothetical protein